MADPTRCPRCNRTDCPTLTAPVLHHGDHASECGVCKADADCAANAVDWYARAQAEKQRADEAERRLETAKADIARWIEACHEGMAGEDIEIRVRLVLSARLRSDHFDAWLAKQKENGNG